MAYRAKNPANFAAMRLWLPLALLAGMAGGCGEKEAEPPAPSPYSVPWEKPPKEVFDYDSPPQIIINPPEVPERIKGPFQPIGGEKPADKKEKNEAPE
jgi:hypothetical protein